MSGDGGEVISGQWPVVGGQWGSQMASEIRIEVQNLDEVRRLLEQLGPRAKAVLPAAVEAGAGVLRDKMASKAQSDGIGVEVDGATALIGPDKEHFYLAFFETGTGAHRVEPGGKRALHWGGEAFSAGHMVGGIAPRPFMRPAVDEGRDEVAAKIGEVILGAVE